MSTTHPHVIGLTGPAGSGKDTVAALLETHCNGYALAFADALRNEIVDAFGIDISMLTRRETKERPLDALALRRCRDGAFVARMVAHYCIDLRTGTGAGTALEFDIDAPRSPRQIMQRWGTEYRRAHDAQYWCDKARAHVSAAYAMVPRPLFVLTDVRFADEAALVRRLGGDIWQIKRPGCGVPPGAHSSEVTGAEFAPDVVINNGYDIGHLQQIVLRSYYAVHDVATQCSEVTA